MPARDNGLMRGARGDAAGPVGAGVAAMVAYVWFPHLALLVLGGVVATLSGVMLLVVLRRGRDWHRQDVLIRKLWTVVKRIQAAYVLADPDTSDLLSAEWQRGWLTLAVIDPAQAGPTALVARYVIGHRLGPDVPPPIRHLGGPYDGTLAWRRLRYLARVAQFNQQTEALEITTAELAELFAKVCRACALPGLRWLWARSRSWC